jgi:hypothetical protein
MTDLARLALGLIVLVGFMAAFAPHIEVFTGMAMGAVDPFTALIIALFVPIVLITFLVSMGVGTAE